MRDSFSKFSTEISHFVREKLKDKLCVNLILSSLDKNVKFLVNNQQTCVITKLEILNRNDLYNSWVVLSCVKCIL